VQSINFKYLAHIIYLYKNTVGARILHHFRTVAFLFFVPW